MGNQEESLVVTTRSVCLPLSGRGGLLHRLLAALPRPTSGGHLLRVPRQSHGLHGRHLRLRCLLLPVHVHQPSAVLHHEPQVPGGVQGNRICSATSSAPPHETPLTFLRFSLAQAMFFRRPSGAVLVGPRGSSGRGATLEKDPRGQPARGYARGGEPTSSRTAQVRMQRGSGGRVGVTRKNFQATAATVAPERKVSSHPLLTRDPSNSVE